MPEDVPNIAQQAIKRLEEQIAVIRAQLDEAREARWKCEHERKRLETELQRRPQA